MIQDSYGFRSEPCAQPSSVSASSSPPSVHLVTTPFNSGEPRSPLTLPPYRHVYQLSQPHGPSKSSILESDLRKSTTMPSSTTSTSSSSSSHSSRGSGHHRSSSQRRSKAHHNLDRAAQEIEDDRTNYRIIRDGGWDNIHHFMLSYGLKPYDPDDYETAKVIIQGFRDRGYYRKSSGSSSSSSRR